MTNWHESPIMIVKSADQTKKDGASLKKMLTEMEANLVSGGYSYYRLFCIPHKAFA
jgi:hypothetical protein